MNKYIKKPIIMLFLTALLIAPLSNKVLATSAPKIFGDNIECKSGETIKYSVNVSDNPGMAGFLICVASEDDWINFNEDAALGDFSSEGSITSSHDAKRINVLWVNPENISNDGTLFTVDIDISPDTPSGEYPIDIFVSEENTLNDTYQEVKFDVINGSINVVHMDSTEETVLDTRIPTFWIVSGAIGILAILAALFLCMKKTRNKERI